MQHMGELGLQVLKATQQQYLLGKYQQFWF